MIYVPRLSRAFILIDRHRINSARAIKLFAAPSLYPVDTLLGMTEIANKKICLPKSNMPQAGISRPSL